MKIRGFWELGHVSDGQLRGDLAALLASGYRTEARIIAHVAEVEERKLHLKDGSESLFAYCVECLGLSNSEAFHRITAARIARRFPVVFGLIERRELHLTAVCLLRDYLTQENHPELLAEASHKTKWQVKELLARCFPRPDVASTIRKLPAARTTPTLVTTGGGPLVPPPPVTEAAEQRRPSSPSCEASSPLSSAPSAASELSPLAFLAQVAAATPPQPASEPAFKSVSAPVPTRAQFTVEPLSEARYRIQLNASSAFKEKLEQARALISHSNPSGDLAVVVERALDSLLEKVQKQRFGQTNRPRKPRTARDASGQTLDAEGDMPRALSNAAPSIPESGRAHRVGDRKDSPRRRQHISNGTRREIAARDGLQCSYVSEQGCRCTARGFLQIHHEDPWARGGGETVDNLRLLCASHNRLLAERDFGAQHVARRLAERARANEAPRTEIRR